MDILPWAISALMIAIVAALFGFSDTPNRATSIGQVLFMLLLIMAGFLFLVSLW